MVGIEPRRIQPRDLNENTNPVATNPRLTTQSNLVILATHFFYSRNYGQPRKPKDRYDRSLNTNQESNRLVYFYFPPVGRR